MLRSFAIKVAMLVSALGLVFWMGWPIPEPMEEGVSGTPLSRVRSKQSVSPASDAVLARQDLQGREFRQDVGPSDQIRADVSGARPAFTTDRLDINASTVDELTALPGVGVILAQRIVNRRTTHGQFRSIEELREVRGIGEKRLAQLRPFITTNSLGIHRQDDG